MVSSMTPATAQDLNIREEPYRDGGPRGWPWIARMGVAYFEEKGEYVLVTQYGAGLLFVVSDNPAVPFKWHHRKDMTTTIGNPNTGDQTVFNDEGTGKSYLVYSYGRGRNRIYISEIGRKDFASKIKRANSDWTTIELTGIKVSGNKVEIGFRAEGEANAFRRVDDVSLVRSK